MTTEQIPNRLVALCREGKFEEVIQELYATDAVSIEPAGSIFPEKVKGVSEMMKKGEQWMEMIQEVHASEISEPIVAENFFALTMKTKGTLKGMNEPTNMVEVCVYNVEDGKIVTEQFFYTPVPQEV